MFSRYPARSAGRRHSAGRTQAGLSDPEPESEGPREGGQRQRPRRAFKRARVARRTGHSRLESRVLQSIVRRAVQSLVCSAIHALINHGIDICAKPASIDSWRTRGCIGNGCLRHEPARPKWPQLRDRSAVACDDDRSACLDLAKDSGGLSTKLSLADCSAHDSSVAVLGESIEWKML